MAEQTLIRARRLRFQRWRDPRLLAGIFLITTTVIIGSFLFAAQDNTQRYWTLAEPVVAGEAVDAGALRSTEVRLGTRAEKHYIAVSEELPARLDELVWARDFGEGELVLESALVPAKRADAELPLSVTAGSFPADLRRGEIVDVWVMPKAAQKSDEQTKRVLSGVAVVSTGSEAQAIGGSLASTIVVAVDRDSLKPEAVAALSAGRITLVRLR